MPGIVVRVPLRLPDGTTRYAPAGKLVAAAPVAVNGVVAPVAQQLEALAAANGGLSATAAVDILDETVVVDRGDGTCAPADPRVASQCGRVLGFVQHGVPAGQTLAYRRFGPLTGLSATYPSDPAALYIADGTGSVHLGGLTTTPPSVAGRWCQQIAVGAGHGIVVGLGPVSVIGDGTGLPSALRLLLRRSDGRFGDEPAGAVVGSAPVAVGGVTAALVDQLAALLAALGARLTAASNLSDLTDPSTARANLNALDRRILSLPGDPGTGDIPSGTIRVAKNTSTGRLSLWANDGGAMVDLLLLSTP